MDSRLIEKEASDVLLDLGVSFPLREWRIPFRKAPVRWRLTMKRPTLGVRIRVAREYLSLDVKHAEMMQWDKEQDLAFVARHGVQMSRIVATSLFRNPLWAYLFTPLMAWVLRWAVDGRMLAVAFSQYIRCLGTEDFTAIIGLLERTNPMQSSPSQEQRGS